MKQLPHDNGDRFKLLPEILPDLFNHIITDL